MGGDYARQARESPQAPPHDSKVTYIAFVNKQIHTFSRKQYSDLWTFANVVCRRGDVNIISMINLQHMYICEYLLENLYNYHSLLYMGPIGIRSTR